MQKSEDDSLQAQYTTVVEWHRDSYHLKEPALLQQAHWVIDGLVTWRVSLKGETCPWKVALQMSRVSVLG